jgi:hypothetical protein
LHTCAACPLCFEAPLKGQLTIQQAGTAHAAAAC